MDEVSMTASGDGAILEDGTPVHVSTVGIHRARDSMILLRPFTSAAIPEFSSISDPLTIRNICIHSVPGWAVIQPDSLVISQVCEGLSNQIFTVSRYSPTEGGYPTSPNRVSRNSQPVTCVLFRVYGKDAEQFYSTDLELQIFRALSKYQIGPKLIANGEGWRIEEWHYAVAVPCRSLPNPSIFCQVASALGRFHKLHRRPDFPDFPKTPATLFRLRGWAENAKKVKFEDPVQQDRLALLNVGEMAREAEWLANLISEEAGEKSGAGFDVVFGHNDLQENNLLQTPYGLRMIDFEYSHFNYQGYDIANFFAEFTMDYTEKSFPFFSTDLAAYPSRESQELFVAVYLSEYLETPVLPSDKRIIDPFLENLEFFKLASHLKWGLWSIIRAPQAPTFDQFDFLLYAKFRFDCYLREKNRLTKESTLPWLPAALAAAAVVVGLSLYKRRRT